MRRRIVAGHGVEPVERLVDDAQRLIGPAGLYETLSLADERGDEAGMVAAQVLAEDGVGLGEVASNFTALSDLGKWLCVVAMLLGRLEIFPLLVLATPSFWRR